VHDDIMKRLLDYQRQLREGESAGSERAPAAVATATVTEDVVDLTRVVEPEAVIELPDVVGSQPAESSVEDETAQAEVRAGDEIARPGAITVAGEEAAPQTDSKAELEAEDIGEAKVEEPAEALAVSSDADLQARVEKLEASLETIGTMLAAVRSDFQDLAIRADERIAELEEVLASVRGSSS
jgi:hypothetical protein